MMATDPAPAPRSDMIGKALGLLTRLGAHEDGAVASKLAREVGLPLSTAHRLLGALVRDQYATFEPEDKRYRLGLRVFQLAQTVARSRGFTARTHQVLEEVSAVTHEATLLTVLDDDRQLYVEVIPGPQQVSVIGRPGSHGPLHCTSQGKVLIAFAEPEVRERLVETVPLVPAGPNAITNRRRFRAEIEATRERGWAVADEEHEEGIRAISVPILRAGRANAAMAVAAPAYRMSVAQLHETLPTLTEAADRLSAVMGVD